MAKNKGKMSKSSLAVVLSRLKGFENPKVRVEQYMTDAETAASILWHAHMQGHIEGKVIADLGAGTGILGLGAALLGAKKVYLVESESLAMKVCKENIEKIKSECLIEVEVILQLKDIKDFDEKVDTVIENPPFGTKVRHADRVFLQKAFAVGDVVYSMHKTGSEEFIDILSRENGFAIKEILPFNYPLKASLSFHSRKIKRINVSCFCLEKK